MKQISYILHLQINCTDPNGFVKPRVEWRDSGNGVAYTSLDILFLNYFFRFRNRDHFEKLIIKVFKGGILYRTPQRTFGQQSWDDYALLACACAVLNLNWIPIVTMICGIMNVWFFDTDGKDSKEDFLGRFVHVWIFMGAATCWLTRWLWLPALALCISFIKGDDWKVWAFHEAYRVMFGIETDEHRRVTALMPMICEKYFGDNHSFTILWKSGLTRA